MPYDILLFLGVQAYFILKNIFVLSPLVREIVSDEFISTFTGFDLFLSQSWNQSTIVFDAFSFETSEIA